MVIEREIRPQKGYQWNFLSCPADVVLGGGAAGAGKTFALLLDAMRGVKLYRNYASLIFRQSYPEIIQPGGLWDETRNIYPLVGGLPNESKHFWQFDTGSRVAFRYLSNDNQLTSYQGAQIPWLGWDELTHFSKKMFLYMMSRNRSRALAISPGTLAFRPKIRATCNPDPDSWVTELVDWYIDQESGFPIPDRAGKIIYFTVVDDMFVFGRSRAEVFEKCKDSFSDDLLQGVAVRDLIKSFAFIPGTISDNQELLRTNPGYLANLMAQSEETKMRLLRGNWKIRVDKLGLFDFMKLNDMFDPDLGEILDDPRPVEHYISIDHARQGSDLCVIGTWRGWKLIRIDIIVKTGSSDNAFVRRPMKILEVVRELRRKYQVPISNIIIDQDGVGVKDALDCRIFQGGGQPYKDRPEKNVQADNRLGSGERVMGQPPFVAMYEHRKSQMAYTLAEKVEAGLVWVNLENTFVHDEKGTNHLPPTTMLNIHGIKKSVREYIRDDLRTLKRENPDAIGRKKITPKDLQKVALAGRSPDFGDMMIMRGEFEFVKKPVYIVT